MSLIILVFLVSFLFGFGFEYYAVRDDIKKAKNLEELKIKYSISDEKNK